MTNSVDKVWETARAFQASRILLTGFELGVFATLGDNAMTSAEVASKIGADPRAADRLMDALVVLGLLTKEEGKFRNSGEARETLVPGKPTYAGGALGHVISLWKSWSTLTDAVRKGTSVFKHEDEARAEFVKPFIAAMHFNASNLAPIILKQIDLTGVRRVLDVGGGSGAYSIAFCKASPEITSVIFDLPDVVPLTNEYAAKAGVADRISTVTGDFNTDNLPVGFDLAFLSQILHSNSPDENERLMRKVGTALNPGGQIVVQEFVVDEDRISPPGPVFFSLNMLVGTKAGDTYTEKEIGSWLDGAGFGEIKRIDPPGTGTTLMMGRKSH